jgi:protein SCO1/2
VVIVSFDAREKPALAAAKKESYVEDYGRPGAANGWHFLTGPQASIDQLCEAAGFHYVFDAKLDQFAHRSGIMVVTPQGKIARYFPGLDYPSRELRFSLVEASEGKIGSPADKLFLLCYHYDPTLGKYTPAVMNFVRLGGALTLSGLGLLLVCVWRREWLRRRKPGDRGKRTENREQKAQQQTPDH